MAGFISNAGSQGLQDGSIDWVNHDIRARLVLSSETLSLDSTFMTGIGDALTDTALSGKTGPTRDDATDRVTIGASDPTFTAVAHNDPLDLMDRVAVFKFVTNDADSIFMGAFDIVPKNPNGADVLVTLNGVVFYTQQAAV